RRRPLQRPAQSGWITGRSVGVDSSGAAYGPARLVLEHMMLAAQVSKIVRIGGSAVGPVGGVIEVGAIGGDTATGEPAGRVAPGKCRPQPGRHRVGLPPDRQREPG